MSNTIRKEDILNCLPLLASVLGKRYGVEVVIDGDTACTDEHTIYLPSLPLDSDESLHLMSGGTDKNLVANYRPRVGPYPVHRF